MLKNRETRSMACLGTLGFVVWAAGLAACDQSVEPAARAERDLPSAQAGIAAPGPANAVPVEGHVLQGAELSSFLERLGPHSEALPASEPGSGSAPAAKTSANPACLVDFGSYQGLARMADHAYTNYATSPWYVQPCTPYSALITPSQGNSYFLPPEAAGTCPGAYGKIGYGTVLNCRNQQDAANFPRYAIKASPYDGDLAFVVTLPQNGSNRPFNANFFFARSGNISVYGRRVDGTWKFWGPVNAASPTFFTLTGGTGLTELRFYASTTTGLFSLDNISVTAQ